MPKIFMAPELHKTLGPEAAATLKEEFLEWLAGDEYDHPSFGKESGFSGPTSAVDENLRHVHLVPVLDRVAYAKWVKRFRRRSQKTSDRILVYVQGFIDPSKYLLITILNEPKAHELMRDRATVEMFANFARKFREKH